MIDVNVTLQKLEIVNFIKAKKVMLSFIRKKLSFDSKIRETVDSPHDSHNAHYHT